MGRGSWMAAGGGAALMVLACGSGPGPASYRGKISPALPSVPPAGGHTVPPDRALIPLAVAAAGDRAAVGAELRGRVKALEAAGAEGACEVRTLHYTPPSATSWGAFQASAELLADVALAAAATVSDRMDALDACLDALDSAQVPPEDLVVGPYALRVDAPEASFGALVDAFAAEQARAASVSGAQAHAEDRRCVPSGQVRVGRAQLAGVELSLDLECRILADGGPPQG